MFEAVCCRFVVCGKGITKTLLKMSWLFLNYIVIKMKTKFYLLYILQATSQFYSVILIGTFLDKTTIKDEELEKKEKDISTKLLKYKLGRRTPVCAISCINNKGIISLMPFLTFSYIWQIWSRRLKTLSQKYEKPLEYGNVCILLVAGQKPATSIFNSFSEMTWEESYY